ncbi:MAG: hypothetical protein ACM3ZV_03850 [Bacillota bacterium]
MSISLEEVLDLADRFHHLVQVEKGDAAEQAKFFLHPNPLIFLPHGEDVTLQRNYEIHQGLTQERCINLRPWDLQVTCAEPERARATGNVYWEGVPVGSDGTLKVIVGEDWIVQRVADGSLKIALYINTHHLVLPDSAALPRL